MAGPVFGVLPWLEIDPDKMEARKIFDSSTFKDPLVTGVSVALEVGDAIYLGAFMGERLVRIPYRK